jgi:hypothetical protein
MSQAAAPQGSLPLAAQPGSSDPLSLFVTDVISFVDTATTEIHEDVSQTIGIIDSVYVENQSPQAIADTLSFSETLEVVDGKGINDTLSFVETATAQLVLNITVVDTLPFTSTENRIYSFGRSHEDDLLFTESATAQLLPFFDVSQRLFLNQSVALSTVLNFELCDCFDLYHDARKATDLTVADSLSFGEALTDPGFNQELVLTQNVTTNAVEGSCCDGFVMYLPDKLISDTLTFSDAVSLLENATRTVADTISFSDTVAYWKVD